MHRKHRKLEPRSMRDGRWLVGWGMATGVWGAAQMPASARITLRIDGSARVASATSDIGPGTYTVMTMIAAEYLALKPEQVTFGGSRLREVEHSHQRRMPGDHRHRDDRAVHSRHP
jgi:CO/xanthine dehydrogenase Mo-binding subunit